jgi:threonine/homoserine/homoserine lactone efflux protein
VALFFLFVPQFIDPAARSFRLGFGCWACLRLQWSDRDRPLRRAGRARRGRAGLGPWAARLNRLLGLLFVGLAVRLLQEIR